MVGSGSASVMQQVNLIEAVAGEFRLEELRIIRDFSVRQELGLKVSGNPSIVMILETEDRNPNVRVKMTFLNATSIKLQFETDPGRVFGFEVFSISDRQMESMNWEVRDFEDGVLHFYCSEARVDSAELI